MYPWIWRHLPGPLPVRIASAAVLILAVVAGLLFGVFPVIEPHLPFSHVTVDAPPSPAPSPTPESATVSPSP